MKKTFRIYASIDNSYLLVAPRLITNYNLFILENIFELLKEIAQEEDYPNTMQDLIDKSFLN